MARGTATGHGVRVSLSSLEGSATAEEALSRWLAGPPSAAAQRAVLRLLCARLAPLLAAHGIPGQYTLEPGLRLRRKYGQCRHFPDGRPPAISVRCTRDGDRARWRRPGAMTLTLVHELAHLKHRHHGTAFWALHRRLLDGAFALGLYDPVDLDPAERASGDEKLAGSAAHGVAAAARAHRLAHTRADRAAALAWQVGSLARVTVASGALAQATVRILEHGRTRLLVAAQDGRRYRVPARLLAPLAPQP